MKINSSYNVTSAAPVRPQVQQAVQGGSDRNDAEAQLRELIARKHAEFDTFRPVEELGKHLDLRA